MRRLRMPGALLCSAIVEAVKNNDSEPESVLVRRTDLPVYEEKIPTEAKNTEENYEPSVMMETVKSFRVEACKVVQTVKSVTDRCSRFIDTGMTHSYSSYNNATEFLREDKNILPRMGAIGGGVVVGYVFGLRRGFFKRLLYMTIGGTSVAAVCYPQDANEYLESTMQLSRRYFVIGYHFLNGITKDFIGFELPTVPQKVAKELDDKSDTKPNQ